MKSKLIRKVMNNDLTEVQKTLEEELSRLKAIAGLGYELRVVYSPNSSSKLSGKVEKETIYIYEEDTFEAIKTLRHEFIDYLVSKAIKPYRDTVNLFIAKVNEEAYRVKEEVVEALLKLFSSNVS